MSFPYLPILFKELQKQKKQTASENIHELKLGFKIMFIFLGSVAALYFFFMYLTFGHF